MTTAASAGPEQLIPFVPLVTLEWLRDEPERTWKEVQGSLAFVDISGFTATSERLSSLGKQGAEELTEVMNATFARLLEVGYDRGGGVLKFGGDALLLFFSGRGHARAAVRAAYEMRRVLNEIGAQETSAGETTLRMHVGIHSGQFQFFLVGDTHRELLVCGPSATETVEMEAISEAGEIVLSSDAADMVDPAWLGADKGSGVLLESEPDPAGSLKPLPDAEGIPLELAVPGPLRAQLVEVGPLEGEHRNAAIGFVRYQGVDELIQARGAAAAAEALDSLVQTIQSAADEHAVTFLESDVDRNGGRIVLIAGAPLTAGDDEERLLRTLRAVVDASPPFPLHIGASRGRVFAGQVGMDYRRTYTILGDTAALAARLMARAEAGEILVSAEAFARARGSFAATELEPFQVKGKSEPVQAFALGALVDQQAEEQAAPAQERAELPFVDREREQAVLIASVAPVSMGFGTLVELVGDPGIGKSRLAEELEEHCAQMVKVRARCDQYQAATAYYPFRPVLRSLLDVDLNGGAAHNREVLAQRLAAIDEELVPWAPLLAAPLDVEVESTPEVDALDPSFWRARLHGVVAKLLGDLLPSPTLLLFDDVHWMDDASSELLRYLGTQLPTRPWLTCTTRRPVEGGFAAAEGTPPLPALTLRLEPLPEIDAKTLIRAAAGDRSLSDDELAAIFDRGAGNPLFLQELSSTEKAAEEGEELPETVGALVATRIDRLAPGDRSLLRWASVLGTAFSGTLIADVLEGDATVAAASEAWERLNEFVERDPETPGGFRFRHALIRDAAYEGLSFKRRHELHGRVAEVIERRQGDRPKDAAELLSLHFYRAERWPEAWRYSLDAGRRADRKYANVEASQFFERALELVERVPEVPTEEVAGVWEALADVRMRMAEYERAADAYRAARTTYRGDVVEQARLMQKEAIAPLRLGRYPLALERLDEAIQLLEDVEGLGAAAQRARLFSWYAAVLQRQRRQDAVIEWCRRAIEEAEISGAEDALAHAYFLLDIAYAALGRTDEAIYSARAAEIYERLGDLDRLAWVLNNQGGHAYLDGRWDEALALFERARQAFARIGDETNATVAEQNIADVSSDQGRLEEAEPLFRKVLEIRRAAGNPFEIAEAASFLGRQAARMGSFTEARALLEEARSLYSDGDDQFEVLTTDTRLAECLVLAGAADAALPLVEATLRRTQGMQGLPLLEARLHRLRGWGYIQTNRLEEAREALDESLRLAQLESENFGFWSADYEIALSLSALVRFRTLSGEPMEELATRRDAILARLGVVSISEPSLETLTTPESRS
ncbi:MAG TPA: tetratricopeptide repeat protein [Gaiellaceae bacterium]|nr:tetratricopeptide repeat protein [Gaiellaceae bacterium]